jgi:preprotein translocase subunit SecE
MILSAPCNSYFDLAHIFATIHTVNKVVSFFSEVRGELSKVVWPKREEVVKLTIIVLLVSAAVGIYVGGLDYFFTKGLEILVSR